MNFKKILVAFSFLLIVQLDAHNRSESYSKFHFLYVEDGVDVKVTGTIKQGIFKLLRPEKKYRSYPEFINYLQNSIDLGDQCKIQESVTFNENNEAGVLKFFWNFKCLEMPNQASITLFQDLGLTHTHIARGSIDNENIPEFMFASPTDLWLINSLAESNRNQSSYLSYLLSGIEHILGGWDHLVFLLGLLLLFQGKFLIIAITGFTIGHSLTLGFGAMNVLRVDSILVEILIGFSILLLALEKFLKYNFEFDMLLKNFIFAVLAFSPLVIFGILEPILIFGLALFLTIYLSITQHYISSWIPMLVTVFFGFIHGLGFASSISDVGLPQDKLLPIILSFNVGVEIGQLAVAFGILAILAFAKRYLSYVYFNSIHNFAGVVVFSMGTFWFVTRAIGI